MSASVSPSASTSPSSSQSPSSSLSRSLSPSKSSSISKSPSISPSVSASTSLSNSPSNSPSPSPSPGIPENDFTREAKNLLPDTSDDLLTTYTTIEEGEVYAFDQRYVDLSGINGEYLIHQFKKTNENRLDDISIRAVVKSSLAPSSSTVFLQIWNGTTNSWEIIDYELNKEANVEFSLDALVDSNEANYYDFGNQIAVRVYQYNDSGSGKVLSIDQIKISFIAKYEAVDETVESNYVEIYPQQSTPDYSPTYPHQNPQDDL